MTSINKTARIVILMGAVLALSACETANTRFAQIRDSISNIELGLPAGSTTEAPAPAVAEAPKMAARPSCPKTTIVKDLNELHQFSTTRNPQPGDKISSIRIDTLKARCTQQDNSTIVDMSIKFEGNLGPRARVEDGDKPSFAYPYFVAITSPTGEIMTKEMFALTATYDAGAQSVSKTEQISQVIPHLADGASGVHAIVVGFQLTEDELAYNRASNVSPLREEDTAINPARIEPAAGGAE